jgi:hypothetical protein
MSDCKLLVTDPETGRVGLSAICTESELLDKLKKDGKFECGFWAIKPIK